MQIFTKVSLSLLLLFLFTNSTFAQNKDKITLSGYVQDAATGETLIGANVYNKDNPSEGTSTNIYGFFSLSLPAGEYTFVFSYLGYTDQGKTVQLIDNQRLTINMSEGVLMQEVVVTAEEADENVVGTQMGTVELPVEDIKLLPALMGEVDILKTLQLLPGVSSAGEGSSGFYVRGGGPDQNLVLLDEATVYNSGHLLGFFSVFNADAIKNTTLIKGGMPASYGGRLSSVVDIQMKDGNDKSYQIDGGIGLIASRLTVQGPIKKDESSFILSARRTYAFDLAQPFLKNTNFAGTNYYFYDLNTKVNYRFSDKDRLYLSGYFGRDVFNLRSNDRDLFFNIPYGNATATLRWNHLFTDKLFLNVSAIYNDYDFGFEGGQADFSVDVFSGIRDYNFKIDFDYFANLNHSFKFGTNYTYHRLTPNIASARSGEETFSNEFEPQYAHDAAIYIQDDWKINDKLRVNIGLRGSMFAQLGPYTSTFDGTEYAKDELVKTYFGLEPRVSANFKVNETTSIKGGITFTNQYLHLVSNSTSTLPTDVWVPSSELVKPQQGLQYAAGWFQNFKNNMYETSIELYYKDLNNQIDYRENYVNNVADEVEQQFVFGEGRSYGAEFFVKKAKGKLNGWIGYTLSKTDRIFEEINNGEPYPATYDRRHDISVVANYEISKKWNVGGVFVYGTGNAFTPLRSLYFIENNLNVSYGARNSARIQPYHRMDLSATWTPKPDSEKRFKSSWTFSVYNTYNRQNPFFISYDISADTNTGVAQAQALKVSIFPVIPSVTWNFKWKQAGANEDKN